MVRQEDELIYSSFSACAYTLWLNEYLPLFPFLSNVYHQCNWLPTNIKFYNCLLIWASASKHFRAIFLPFVDPKSLQNFLLKWEKYFVDVKQNINPVWFCPKTVNKNRDFSNSIVEKGAIFWHFIFLSRWKKINTKIFFS